LPLDECGFQKTGQLLSRTLCRDSIDKIYTELIGRLRSGKKAGVLIQVIAEF